MIRRRNAYDNHAAYVRQVGVHLARYGAAADWLIDAVAVTDYDRRCVRVELLLRRVEAGEIRAVDAMKQLQEES